MTKEEVFEKFRSRLSDTFGFDGLDIKVDILNDFRG